MPDATTSLHPELDEAALQRALAVLIDVGTALVLECKIPTPEANLATRALAYARAAEAVRRTILLAQHIAQSTTRATQSAETATAAAQSKRATARKQILRAVEDTIQRAARPANAQALRLELLERIDSPDFADDLANRPPEQLIAELCRDMALADLPGRRPALRRTPDDIAILCAQAAAPPGAGLLQWVAVHPQPAPSDPAPTADPQRHPPPRIHPHPPPPPTVT